MTMFTLASSLATQLSSASRFVKRFAAATLVLASLSGQQALAQVSSPPELRVDGGVKPHPGHDDATPFFTKVGVQRGCDTVVYNLRFGLTADVTKLADPLFGRALSSYRMDFSDQLPAGLTITNVQVTGDGTKADGSPLSSVTVSTTATPDDTASIEDFRLSATDLDGLGAPNERFISVRIIAAIDHSTFPAPTMVANQAFVKVSVAGAPSVSLPSHDPNLPDDADFLTGAPTKILIDVTKCDPPPPPPRDQPCFKVERGEVDCIQGGGAFLYHMPVGPELGGKWVQVRATDPGITVSPAVQNVPVGGGVLDWTISGASPGETVHLIVTGVDAYGDGRQGVSICCTQRIDIVIPPDLRCPPEHKRPDLKIEKRADVARCTPEGGCDFTITVTNVGDGPFNGPIVLDEVTTPGSASIVTGPNPPWTCAPSSSPMVCSHPATTLNSGQSVELKLGFAPGPAWNGRVIRNCAAYNPDRRDGPGRFDDPANNRACASIPICKRGDRDCQPPPEKRVDLRITKVPRSLSCSADGVCSFLVRVFNNGSGVYAGPLTVADAYPSGAPASSTFGPTPPWTCGPTGPGQFLCQHPGVVLAPGASVPLSVVAIVPADYRSDTVKNCAEVSAIAGETDLSNNRACADMRIPRKQPEQPKLRVEKTGDKECRAGAPCTFEITIANDGPGAFSGPMRIGDAIGVDGLGRLEGVAISSVEPPFGCAPEPATLPLSCIANISLAAGESRVHRVTVVIPDDGALANLPERVPAQNCVGVLPPDTAVIAGGPQLSRAGAGGNRQSACHDFTIVHEVRKQCSQGLVMNADGRCVCPQGTSFKNGQCVGKPVPPPPPPPKKQCVLLEGQIRTNDGRCVCPKATTLKNGKCVSTEPPPVRQCKLLKGQIRTESGDCVCPRGTSLVNGECRRREVQCPQGTVLVRGKCVRQPPPETQCRRGEVLRNGECVIVLRDNCPAGTVGTPPNCRMPEQPRKPRILIDPGLIEPFIPRRQRGNDNQQGGNQRGVIPQ